MKPLKNSPFTNIGQVGVVVEDIDKTIAQLTPLGIGPFKQVGQFLNYHEYRGYKSKGNELKPRIKITKMGNTDFELIQPPEAPSIWRDFLKEKGEGLHHLGFFVHNIDQVESELLKEELKIVQKGRSDIGGGYTYFETDEVGGVIFEIVEQASSVEIPQTRNGENPFAVLHQVASIVADIDKTVNYYSLLGIGPFKELKMELTHRWLRGMLVQPKNKILLTQVGDVEMELIQPIEGSSIHMEFLTQRGEGFQHLGFSLNEEIHDEIEKIAKLGATKSAYGYGPGNAFSYYEPISGIILEVFKRESQE